MEESNIEGYDDLRHIEYFSIQEFLDLVERACVDRPWNFMNYNDIMSKLLLSMTSFSDLQKKIREDSQCGRVPCANMRIYIPAKYHKSVERFLVKYNKTIDQRNIDGNAITIWRHVCDIDMTKPIRPPSNLNEADVIYHLINAYAISTMVSLILSEIIAHINGFFVENAGKCPDKEQEWKAIKMSYKGRGMFNPWTIVRFSYVYGYYQECIRITDFVKAQHSLSETIDKLPKRLGLKSSNLLDARLRQRRHPLKSKFL